MTQIAFDHRLAQVVRKHALMARGITYRIASDGLITAHPRRRVTPRFPLRSLASLALVAFGFKAFLFAALGADTYVTRLADLQAGGLVERAGAWLMQPDAVTTSLAAVMSALAS